MAHMTRHCRLMAPEDRQEFSDMIMEVSLCQIKHHITKILKVRECLRRGLARA